MNYLLTKIKETNEELITELDKFLPLKDIPERRLIEAMRYSSMSKGKRIRPLLVLESCKLFDVPRFQAIRVALAVELVHCYSLIHDDLPAMDNDDFRRGIPTCHKQYDEATAILAGNNLLVKAFEILSSTPTNNNAKVRSDLVLSLSKATDAMIRGQMIDLLPPEEQKPTLHYIKRIEKLKTGALIRFSCSVGAEISSQADEDDVSRMRAYADNIGIAFQISDDILDAEGDEKRVGKRLKKDLDKKTTFVSLLGLEGAKVMAKELVDNAVLIMSEYGQKAKIFEDIAKFILKRDF